MKALVLCLLVLSLCIVISTEQYTLPYIATVRANIPSFEAAVSAGRIAAKAINEGYFPAVDLQSNLTLDMRYNSGVVSDALIDCISVFEEGHTLSFGYNSAAVAVAAGNIGTAYGMCQFTDSSSTALLSNPITYPYFARANTNTRQNAEAIKSSLLYYGRLKQGWDNVAVIAKPDQFSVDGAVSLINTLTKSQINVVAFQQFLIGAIEFDLELSEIQQSGARIIAAFVSFEWPTLLEEANKYSLVGDNYVWYVHSTVVAIPFAPMEFSRGAIGFQIYIPQTSPQLKLFEELWYSADTTEFPNAGGSYNAFQVLAYDAMVVVGHAAASLEQQGLLHDDIPAEKWFDELKKAKFKGVTGDISFNANGDRIADVEMVYYSPERGWVPTAIYSPIEESYTIVEEVTWQSNTTVIPDLDIRSPFDYWSCHEKEKFTDSTGKTITRHTPNGSDIDDIDIDYYCDAFIDCQNFSDESKNCSSNYLAVFIVYGIVTGLLILLSLAILLFVLVFGVFLGFRRLRKASTTFLIVIVLSVIVGYCSVFSWFGKAHPVACGFQPWLLGLPSLSIIVSLSVKNFRMWRFFKFPMKKLRITDLELALYWCLLMIPAVVILALWTIISTPTASMKERDGREHYVCTTGGFTGEPGGIIFFSIFVGYAAVILLFGAIISFVSRNVPSEFSESKLLTVSIYNLGFLSVIIIPVFLVVQPFNPFIAWILRTTAILYAFTATLILQFFPILWGIVVIDKLKNNKVFKSTLTKPRHSDRHSTNTK